MQFKFESDQEFQLKAIESVTRLFDGQRYTTGQFDFNEESLGVIPNSHELDNDAVLQNLQQVQADNDLPADEELLCIEEELPILGEEKCVSFHNFSIEMETGTGKTYVYVRTIFELFRRYGLRKFIIVVPSIAVREGVLKTLQITQDHLRQLYDSPPCRFYTYDSSKMSQVRQFAYSDGIEIVVMTIDSFNRESNRIHQTMDQLHGDIPIHLIQATRPVLVLDEPQNMVSELRVRALAALNPLFALRYSATHRDPYNLVYRLTPADAYQQGLVKRIEVDTVLQEDDVNQAFIQVNGIQNRNNKLIARLSVHKLMRDATVKEQSITVGFGDDLAEKTNRPEYSGYIVDEINLFRRFVRFTNGVAVEQGESKGEDKESIFETQIRITIEEHFFKQEQLKSSNIKVLSLFFIDRVDNYAQETGIIRQLFKKCFNELKQKQEHASWKDVDIESVQASYFAQRRTRAGDIIYEDSKSGESQKDAEAYDLIMKDKERLLSFDEPTCFIFSHSALREGWDSPNVFQICTLNQTTSEMKKRQEIGRGVRLAVDQSGDRVFDETVNILTVVANESYASYVASLQTEMLEAYGAHGVPPAPVDKRKRRVAKLRKAYIATPDFEKLWKRIKHKTRYAVNIDTDQLVDKVVAALDETEIQTPRVVRTRIQVQIDDDHVLSALQISGAKTVMDLSGRYPLPNLVDAMMHLLENTTPPMRLTKRTLLEIFRRTQKQQSALDNPHEFASVAVRIIKEKLTDQLIDGIKYEKIGECYEMCQFEMSIKSWEDRLIPAERSLYDHVIFDSEVERRFVEGLEKRSDVKLYVKLPAFFKVPTPIGNYNPDWAIVVEDPDREDPMVYLVRETKGTTNPNHLRPDERRKVDCGKRHFGEALDVDYEIVDSPFDLRIKS